MKPPVMLNRSGVVARAKKANLLTTTTHARTATLLVWAVTVWLRVHLWKEISLGSPLLPTA